MTRKSPSLFGEPDTPPPVQRPHRDKHKDAPPPRVQPPSDNAWRVEVRAWKKTDDGTFVRTPFETVRQGTEPECRDAIKAIVPRGNAPPVDVRLWRGDRLVDQKTR